MASGNPVLPATNSQPPAAPFSGDDSSILRFEHVTVKFDEEIALNDVSFDVRRGQTRIILGAAGAGKSVLLKAATGLVPIASGDVFLFDQQTTNLPEGEMYAVRSRVGMAFQESALFDSMTIAQNVAYPLLNQPSINSKPDDARAKVKEALEFVELGQTLQKFPSELSGGMRRRAAIARAVVTKPPLLLYDSPTAGLDPITAYTIMALIVKERDVDDTTALVVTHRYQDGNLVANFRYNSHSGTLEPSRQSDSTRFMVMRDGRLIFEGDQDELEASTDPYIIKFVKHAD
ncbi:MAG TPA: ATP-binding cassette domain-containing protein [Bryobacteraceae bacterium]|jgi:phospholipid/cholesterol/gamma-HCH transport system ATP-binding protein